MNMKQYDSKLFFGIKLKLVESNITDILHKLYTHAKNPPTLETANIYECFAYYNTLLPIGIYIDLSYDKWVDVPPPIITSRRECNPEDDEDIVYNRIISIENSEYIYKDFYVHINLLDRDELTLKQMKKFIKKVDRTAYAHFLGTIGLPYQEPKFYTEYYNYC